MDAVRFDHLSCYGYERKTSPNIDEISNEGVLFENAFSASAWTAASMPSIFTGKYPSHHHVLRQNSYLDENNLMITEILKSYDYRTFGANISPLMNRSMGYDRGWDKFWESYKDGFFKKIPYFLKYVFRNFIEENWRDLFSNKHLFSELKDNFSSFYTISIVKKWIRNLPKNIRFFLYIHFLEAHSPYNPLNRFRKKFEREIGSSMDMKKLKYLAGRGRWGYVARKIEVSKNEFDVLKSWYDAEISYIDYRLKELFDFLKEKDLDKNTVIIITSDHGENFGEHNLMDHQYCLCDTLLHVPLIIYDPRFIIKGGKKIHSIVSLVDIFPTILDMVGAKINDENYSHIDGESLASLEEKKYHNYVFAEYGRPDFKIYKEQYPDFDVSIISEKIKCVRSVRFKYIMRSNGSEELYNLEEDPNEKVNIIHQCPEEAELLKSELNKRLGSFRETQVQIRRINQEEKVKKRLRELGYL